MQAIASAASAIGRTLVGGKKEKKETKEPGRNQRPESFNAILFGGNLPKLLHLYDGRQRPKFFNEQIAILCSDELADKIKPRININTLDKTLPEGSLIILMRHSFLKQFKITNRHYFETHNMVDINARLYLEKESPKDDDSLYYSSKDGNMDFFFENIKNAELKIIKNDDEINEENLATPGEYEDESESESEEETEKTEETEERIIIKDFMKKAMESGLSEKEFLKTMESKTEDVKTNFNFLFPTYKKEPGRFIVGSANAVIGSFMEKFAKSKIDNLDKFFEEYGKKLEKEQEKIEIINEYLLEKRNKLTLEILIESAETRNITLSQSLQEIKKELWGKKYERSELIKVYNKNPSQITQDEITKLDSFIKILNSKIRILNNYMTDNNIEILPDELEPAEGEPPAAAGEPAAAQARVIDSVIIATAEKNELHNTHLKNYGFFKNPIFYPQSYDPRYHKNYLFKTDTIQNLGRTVDNKLYKTAFDRFTIAGKSSHFH